MSNVLQYIMAIVNNFYLMFRNIFLMKKYIIRVVLKNR